jgi:hypothetical protein
MYIENIDAAIKKAPLPYLYDQINKSVGGLGISIRTFAQYIRRARKESGSSMYRPRSVKKRRTPEDIACEQTMALGKVLNFAWRRTLLDAETASYCDFLAIFADEALALDSDKRCFANAVQLIRNDKPLSTPNDICALL